MWRTFSLGSALAALLFAVTPAKAQKQYDPGADDSEIRIGTTTPYSGPASAYSAGAMSISAYFTMINAQGGVNGRKLNFISLDDAYSPPKTVEQIRRLIESDEVMFLVNPVGTATNMAVLKYINQKRSRISSSAPARPCSTIPNIIRGRSAGRRTTRRRRRSMANTFCR